MVAYCLPITVFGYESLIMNTNTIHSKYGAENYIDTTTTMTTTTTTTATKKNIVCRQVNSDLREPFSLLSRRRVLRSGFPSSGSNPGTVQLAQGHLGWPF